MDSTSPGNRMVRSPSHDSKTASSLDTLHESQSVGNLAHASGVATTGSSTPVAEHRGHAARLSESILPKRPSSAANGDASDYRRPGPSSRASISHLNGHTPSSNLPIRRSSAAVQSSLDRPIHTPDPDHLLRVQNGVIKGRSGSVLSRGFILKNDRLPSNKTHALDFRLKGVPNFRSGGEGVYGAAQPSITGLRTVLAVLGCHPTGASKAVWVCTREEPVIYIGGSPFVLRDAEEPFKTFGLSERPEALESIERRLKTDILREAARYGGVVQVEEEINDADGGMTSTWVAASADNVMTIRELWSHLVEEGYHIDYHRIAFSSDEHPENKYLDAFLDVLRGLDTNISLFFNCGAGVVRTTFAMTLALLVRRHQTTLAAQGSAPARSISRTRGESVIDQNVRRYLLAEANATTKRNHSLLRMTSILNSCVPPARQQSALTILLSQPDALENLRRAGDGDYDIILNLLSCLENGNQSKALADAAIDQCASITNLREDVLAHRIKVALAAMDDSHRDLHLRKAVFGLERYFFLVAFASYITSTDVSPNLQYSEWLQSRAELRNMVERMRKPANSSWIFKPVADLSVLSRGGPQLAAATPLAQTRLADVRREGAEAIGDEFAAQLVRTRRGITLRAGTILKKDIWRDAVEDGPHDASIRGALNFRQIRDTDIYALSQPTDSGIVGVLGQVNSNARDGQSHRTTWVNLREEPLVYINGAPYVLREEALSLRNLKSYAGISATRLELIEDRLKRDILSEIKAGDGRLLLHSERPDKSVVAVWESVEPENVATLREIMESLRKQHNFNFRRMPITAEGPPNVQDIAELIEVVSMAPLGHSVIVNCQLGRGRSTLVSVMLLLFRRWLVAGGKKRVFAEAPADPPKTLAYAVINNLIRVIRNGREIRMHVDSAIQECSEIYNLLDAIEDARQRADDAADAKSKGAAISGGINELRRYFTLILFASWLNESEGGDLRTLREEHSFEKYLHDRPVFETISKEIDSAKADALVPLDKSSLGDGVAVDEVEAVVAGRTGRILSAATILKSDFFSNLQKLSLPERVEGAPNYRRAPMYLESSSDNADSQNEKASHAIYGTGMPTVNGLRTALEKMGAGSSGNTWVYWTLMREEPVIFVRGRPHVLRLLAMPLENVITTGVTTESVEGQEQALKTDVLREAQRHGGRLLLHDETDDGNGRFTITAQWEEGLSADDILTPADAFAQMIKDGLRLDYARLPVTDEQAPMPRVFARLEERVNAASQHPEVAMAFNCQMGRGRTTSAMVAASLAATILHPVDAVETTTIAASDAGVDDTFAIRDIQDPYQHGEYKVIFQLVSVLQYGKLAKQLADAAIDQCEAVQNLRKAVATYRMQWESAEKGSSKKEKIFTLAYNYLYRYGTLIAFANYLLEKSEAQSGKMSSSFTIVGVDDAGQDFPPFPEYLLRRPEINHILSRKSLD